MQMRIVFMGTPDFSVPVLKRLITDGYEVAAAVTQPDRPKGRKKVMTPSPVKAEAQKQGIPVLQPQKIRHAEDYQQVLDLKPDVIITAAYGQILPKAILEEPRYGCMNVHASLLPEYRGGAPIHQAIIDGKQKTGVTIMYMAEKLDAGDILTQKAVPIGEKDDVGTMHDKLSAAGAELLSETLPQLVEGKINAAKQDESKATFAANITRDNEKIDWNKGGAAIYNQIRGLRPWPVAYTTENGRVLKIWNGEKVESFGRGEPGTVAKMKENSFIVHTGDETAINVTELQPAGKKRMSAEQFLQGTNLKEGTKLGDNNETENGA
jgi:methionyl-tRNA formyltransferase